MGSRPSATTLEPEMTADELAALKGWLAEGPHQGTHLEIGTAAGGTLCFMMGCFEDAERPRFAVVDSMKYFADQLETVRRNLRNHDLDPDQVDFRETSSSEAFATAQREQQRFDFILVDASHKIRHVMDDLRWMSLLNVGGCACFHDYTPRFKGVRWPIDRFLRRNPNFERVGLADSLLCVRKTAPSTRPEVSGVDRLWARLCSPLLQWDLSLQKRLSRGS